MIRCTTQTQTDSDDRAGSGGDSGENVKTGRCWCTWRQKWSSFETYSHNILFIMSHLHQMSIHLSCTETILVICFRSVFKRQQLWRHPRLMMQRTPAIRTFKKCREFFCGENTRFVYHWIRLGNLQYVHTQPLPRLRAFLSCIIVKGSCTNAGTGPGCYWFRSFAEEFSASKKKTYLTVSLNPIQE